MTSPSHSIPSAAHTPTPWAVSSSTMIVATEDKRDLAIICNTIDLVGVSDIGIHEARANAELIVSAVNSHASDQRRIKELEEALAELYTNEKLDDDDPKLMATRTKVSALLSQGAPK